MTFIKFLIKTKFKKPKEKYQKLSINRRIENEKSLIKNNNNGNLKKCILHLSGRSDLSGGPITMMRLIQGQDKKIFSHIVVCPNEEDGIVVNLKKLSNVKIIDINLRIIDFRVFLKLHKIFKEKKIDLIHCHGKAAGIYGRPMGKFLNIPVLHQFHGLHYRHYNLVFKIIYLSIERLLSKWSKKIICVSESECAEAERLKLFSPGKGIVIHNGVDGKRFYPNNKIRIELRNFWKIPENDWVLLAITRANVQKNLKITFEVHNKLRKFKPNCTLILAGVSYKELHYMKKKNILSDLSHIICAPPEHQMERLINVADCYISTSLWEGFSVGLLEALAMKLPAVISRVTGNLDLSGLEPVGIHLVPQADIEAYAKKIFQLLTAEISGRNARSTIIERYSQKKIDILFSELYSNILDLKMKNSKIVNDKNDVNVAIL